MKKSIMAVILSLVLLMGIQFSNLSMVGAADAADTAKLFDGIDYQMSANLRVIIDGEQIMFDVNPQSVNNTTLVPMRDIFEALGLIVDWDNTTQTATGTGPDISISFTIGSNKALVNNEEKNLGVPARIIDNNTMIPLRFLAENMGYHVVWVGGSNLILISQSDIVEWRYEGYEIIPPYKEYEVKYINGLRAAETRYTGKNHEVKFYNLFSADGRLVPHVPEFNLGYYGSGWLQKSPFVGKIYWVDLDVASDRSASNRFYDPGTLQAIDNKVLRESAPAGNYLKVRIDEHFFALDAWKALGIDSNPELSSIQDEKLLEGKEIKNSDTLLRVTINDQYRGVVTFGNLIGSLFEPATDQIYAVLDRDPRVVFDWPDSTWIRLKGENPWPGMTKDMLLVQLLSKPDIISKTATRFTVFELWIYEYEYEDSVYFFDNGILTAMW